MCKRALIIMGIALCSCDAGEHVYDTVESRGGWSSDLALESNDEEDKYHAPDLPTIEISEAPDVQFLNENVVLVGWTNPMPAIEIGPTSAWSCFLAKFSGALTSADDRARVYVSDGKWYVSGAGAVAQVTAQCVAAATMATPELFEYKWSQAEFYARETGASGAVGKSDRICGLTSLRGQFDGAGDELRAYRSGFAWLFGGKASTANQSISGTVQCAIPASLHCVGSSKSWTQGQAPVTLPVSSSPNGLNTGAFCVLTRVAGKFDTSEEWVGLWHSGSGVYLGGASTTNDVSVEAQCSNGGLINSPPGWPDCLWHL